MAVSINIEGDLEDLTYCFEPLQFWTIMQAYVLVTTHARLASTFVPWSVHADDQANMTLLFFILAEAESRILGNRSVEGQRDALDIAHLSLTTLGLARVDVAPPELAGC
jgi:hypothetical protein